MSHFSVLVTGPDYESALAPFHEFECTGRNDEFVVDVDKTDEARSEFASEDGGAPSFLERAKGYYAFKAVAHGAAPDTNGEHKFGYLQLDASGELIKVVERTNPNKQWDWYVLGGRWGGFFKLKSGGTADQALKGAIDFEAMREEGATRAAERWDLAHSVAGGRSFASFESMTEGLQGELRDRAIEAYHKQPALIDLRKHKTADGEQPFLWSVDGLALPRAAFVARARLAAVSAFALLHEGQWHERGKMGWFGVVADGKPQGDWAEQFNALVDSLPDDTVLSLVDCHI